MSSAADRESPARCAIASDCPRCRPVWRPSSAECYAEDARPVGLASPLRRSPGDAAGRWQFISDVVICTTTGRLTREQLMWAGVLHAGPGSAVGGLTALERRGLKNWHRDEITVLLPKSHNLEPLPGVRFVEHRRPVGLYATGALPTWRVEPAALLFAGYVAS